MGPAGGFPTLGQWPTPAIRTLATAYEGDGITAEKVKSFISESLFDQSAITDELVKGRLEAAMDPRIIAQPPMRLESGQPIEELWRDPGLATLPHQTLIIWGRGPRGSARYRNDLCQAYSQCATQHLSEVRPLGAMGMGGSVQSSRFVLPLGRALTRAREAQGGRREYDADGC